MLRRLSKCYGARLADRQRKKSRPKAAFFRGSTKRQTFFTCSRILKVDFEAPWNNRLNAFDKQRRSSVLRRVRLRSAMCESSGRCCSLTAQSDCNQFKLKGLPGGSPFTDKALAMTYFLTGNPQYHRRNVVSRSCSEWEGVGPTRYGRQEFSRRVGNS